MKTYGACRYKTPLIVDLGSRYKEVETFTLRVLYPGGKSVKYQMARRLGGPQNL
jgi:hypothetical protein